MTTPVSASGAGDRWTVSFMMPSKWTMDTLPVPKDPRIDLVEVAPDYDHTGTTTILAAQILLNTSGRIAHNAKR